MGNGNQKVVAKYGAFGPLPRSSWLHLFSKYLSVKELRQVVFLNKAFSQVAIEAFVFAKKNRLSNLGKVGALKVKPLMRVDKKAARSITFLSNGHLALLTHDTYPEIYFYNRLGEKIDSISAFTYAPTGAEKERYDNIADMAPLPKSRLALLDSGKKQIVVVQESGVVHTLIRLVHKTPVAMAASADGTELHVADQLEQNITTYSVAEAKVLYKCNFQIPTTLTGLMTAADGSLLIPNPKTASIRLVDPKTGAVVREIGDGPGKSENRIKDPRGVDMDQKGRFFIADISQQMVYVMDTEGRVLHSFGKNVYFKGSHPPVQVRLRDDGAIGVLIQSQGVMVF